MWIAIGDAHGSDRVIVWVATCIGGCGTMVAGNNCWLWQCGVFGGGGNDTLVELVLAIGTCGPCKVVDREVAWLEGWWHFE